MLADFEMSYKGYKINHYAHTGCWSITKSIPGRFFEKVEYIATLYSQKSCIDFIDSL